MTKPVVVPKPGAKAAAPGSRPRKRIRLTPRQALHIAHRLGILVMALHYVVLNFMATFYTKTLLTLDNIPAVTEDPVTSPGIAAWIGTTTIRESPLVMTGLGNSTAPRSGVMYLDSSGASFNVCASMATTRQLIYESAFQRKIFRAYVDNTSYSPSYLTSSDLELITPVVDCNSANVYIAAKSSALFYYLVHRRSAPDDVYIMVLTVFTQMYAIPEQHAVGPTAFTTLALVNDLQASQVDHVFSMSYHFPYEPMNFRICNYTGITYYNQWSMLLIPRNASLDVPKNITTTSTSGFYLGTETEQAHLQNQVLVPDSNPTHAITRYVIQSKTIVRDTWGWVHFVQLFFGFEFLVNLIPLMIIAYRNLKAGKLWVGDAFVAISSTMAVRSVTIIITWYASRFWTLKEFCMHDAYKLSGIKTLTIYESIAKADLLGLYLSVCGILGILTRERVDPFLACVCFHIGFSYRTKIAEMFPSIVDMATTRVISDITAGAPEVQEGQASISPMLAWTTHRLESTSPSFIMSVLGPIAFTLIFVLLQIIFVKIYHRVFPSKTRVLKRATDTGSASKSGGETALLYKRVLTLFEIATGAELENRFGLMSSYENYVFFKGMKFASADGVYSNGFVIVNDKFVIPISAYFKIIIMKLLRKRYTSIYVYEMAGTTVQQTARLVYPETMTFADLLCLEIRILS